MKKSTQSLIEEFEAQVGLSPVEARRSAFIALAISKGWNNARVARYLGVHRQRISQKLEKYAIYCKNGKMPALKTVMSGPDVDLEQSPGVVQFAPTDWEDREFADGMLNLVESGKAA